MTNVHITAGVCGLQTTVQAESDDDYEVKLVITSDCARISSLGRTLHTVSALQEISLPINQTAVYQAAGQCRLHASCPVPCGIIKALEHAAGLALPADVQITITA